MLVRLRQSVAVGLERPEVCHHHNIQNHHRLYPSGIYRFLSERRLRCTARKELACVPLLAKLGGRHLQYPESYVAILLRAVAGSSTVRRQRNGMQTELQDVPRRQSWL